MAAKYLPTRGTRFHLPGPFAYRVLSGLVRRGLTRQPSPAHYRSPQATARNEHQRPESTAQEEPMKITANGISVNYTFDGPANGPVVTMSHSLATDLGMWDPTLSALTS